MSACGSCGASIWWSVTEAGKSMPIDATPDPDGIVFIDRGVAKVLGPIELALLAEGAPRWTSHFATCPNADEHRRSR